MYRHLVGLYVYDVKHTPLTRHNNPIDKLRKKGNRSDLNLYILKNQTQKYEPQQNHIYRSLQESTDKL